MRGEHAETLQRKRNINIFVNDLNNRRPRETLNEEYLLKSSEDLY